MAILNPFGPQYDLARKGIPLGRNKHTSKSVWLPLAYLWTHLHVLGPTGGGKTRFLLHLFQWLTHIRKATIILIDPKGGPSGLFAMARDWCMATGRTKRLTLFEPGNRDMVCGYNPALPNGLSIGSHAKLMRESIEAGFGQSAQDFHLTPQLHRLLFLILFAIRELKLTLAESLALARPKSELRALVLPRIQNPHVREAFTYFDSLPERRQEELMASTLARLEPLLMDDDVRRIFVSEQRTLRVEDVIQNHRLLLVNLAKGKPLRRDDCYLIGRILVNDIVNKALETSPEERGPVFLIIDEVQNVATRDLTDCLDEGRGNGIHCIVAHQTLAQLKDEETSGYLYHSVLNNCRTRICFGGAAPEDLEVVVPRLFLDHLNPWALKDELSSLEVEPVETTRVSRGRTYTKTTGVGLALPESESFAASEAETDGTSASLTHSRTDTRAEALTQGQSRTNSFNQGTSTTEATHWADTASGGTSWSATGSRSLNADGASYGWAATDGGSRAQASTRGGSRAQTVSDSQGYAETDSESTTSSDAVSTGVAQQVGVHHATTRGTTRTTTKGRVPSWSESDAYGVSETEQPFHELHTRRVVSSRTFLSLEEQKLLLAQQLEAQPIAHCVLKVPTKPAVFLTLPRIEPAWLSRAKRRQGYERIWTSQPCYASPDEIDQEEQHRRARLFLGEVTAEPLQYKDDVSDDRDHARPQLTHSPKRTGLAAHARKSHPLPAE